MTAEYSQHGIHFLYPENWHLAGDDEPGWPQTVSVHSPSGAFWSVTRDNGPSEQLLASMVDAVAAEYEDVERSPFERQLGAWRLRGVEMHFYCLDFLVVAQVLEVESEQERIVLLMQAESREFDELRPIFDAISLSLLS